MGLVNVANLGSSSAGGATFSQLEALAALQAQVAQPGFVAPQNSATQTQVFSNGLFAGTVAPAPGGGVIWDGNVDSITGAPDVSPQNIDEGVSPVMSGQKSSGGGPTAVGSANAIPIATPEAIVVQESTGPAGVGDFSGLVIQGIEAGLQNTVFGGVDVGQVFVNVKNALQSGGEAAQPFEETLKFNERIHSQAAKLLGFVHWR